MLAIFNPLIPVTLPLLYIYQHSKTPSLAFTKLVKERKSSEFLCFLKIVLPLNCIKASAPQRPSRAFCICPILLALAGGGILALQV